MTQKLLLIVNVDWFFISHRLEIGLEAIKQGAKVHIACQDTGKCAYLESLGFKVHRLGLSRTKSGLVSEISALREIYKLIKTVAPDVLHLVTIKPIVYGGISARWLNIPQVVASISGLGFVFTDARAKVLLLRRFISRVYRYALSKPNVSVIFQNSRDRDLFLSAGIIQKQQVNMIRGSGVDLGQYQVKDEPAGLPVAMFLARLLIDKGVGDFSTAADLVNATSKQARFVIVGDLDPENPNALSEHELKSWVDKGSVEYWGFTFDAADTISKSNMMVLPSFYAEGLPKSLIEAAACGRAVITTNMPGCRDAIEPDLTGLLIPPKDPKKLAEAIQYLIDNHDIREQMGKEGRRLAETAFDVQNVVKRHMEIYGLDT